MVKHHLTDEHMKENANNDCIVNKKSVKNRNELDQNLSGCRFIQGESQNNESKSLGERFKRISSKVDFSVVTDPNIWWGLIL